jgi:RNA polymerase sigma-70 factor, ECF subfamily
MAAPPEPSIRLLDSRELLRRVSDGDAEAREELALRYRPLLVRFARARLPMHARSRFETEDLVQEAFVRAFEHLGSFSPQRRGAFLAYLREIVMNTVRDELRSAAHRRGDPGLAELAVDPRRDPLDTAFDREALDAYQRALATLKPDEQEAVVLRLEMDCGYDEVARLTGRRSANAARMLVVRAVARLAEAMARFRTQSCGSAKQSNAGG